MANITEIIDSKQGLISSDKSDPGCPSVKQMRESQAAGATGNGTQAGSHNDQERPFAQNYDDGGSDDETPSDDSESVPGLGF